MSWILDSGGKSLAFQTPGDADVDTNHHHHHPPFSYLCSDLILHRKPCGDKEELNRWIVLCSWLVNSLWKENTFFMGCSLPFSRDINEDITRRDPDFTRDKACFYVRYCRITSLNVLQLILIQCCRVSLKWRSISQWASHKVSGFCLTYKDCCSTIMRPNVFWLLHVTVTHRESVLV